MLSYFNLLIFYFCNLTAMKLCHKRFKKPLLTELKPRETFRWKSARTLQGVEWQWHAVSTAWWWCGGASGRTGSLHL